MELLSNWQQSMYFKMNNRIINQEFTEIHTIQHDQVKKKEYKMDKTFNICLAVMK